MTYGCTAAIFSVLISVLIAYVKVESNCLVYLFSYLVIWLVILYCEGKKPNSNDFQPGE